MTGDGERSRRGALLLGALVLGALTDACEPDVDTTPAPTTRRLQTPLDCVAILGMIPDAPTLDAVPYSGVPRGKLISELSDPELARACDFETCLGANGYRRACTHYYPGIESVSENPFVLEATPYVEEALETCYPDTSDGRFDRTPGDAAGCIAGARTYYDNCPNDFFEDCQREGAAPVAGAPTCKRIRTECPL